MSNEYAKLIEEHDKTLSLLRSQWLEADEKHKSQFMGRMNSSLDERLRLMRLRDGGEP
jgi:hypothetical protein